MSNNPNLENLVEQAESILERTRTLLSGEDSKQLAGRIANVAASVPRTWNDREETVSRFVTDLVNKSLGLDGTLRLTLKNSDPSADLTDFSNWMVSQSGSKNTGAGVSLDRVVNYPEQIDSKTSSQSVYASAQSTPLPNNPETGTAKVTKTDETQLNSLAQKIFWAAYDLLNTTNKDKYRWGTPTMISLPGTDIQNISVDLAALLEVLPEANNAVARTMPSNSGMGAGYEIQNASDSLKSVLESKIKQEGGGYGTMPIKTSTGLLVSSYENTWEDSLDMQMTQSPKVYSNQEKNFVDANRDQVKKYMDPDNYNEGNAKYQFLDLTAPAGISEEKLAQFLKGKGILEGMAGVFLEAAKESKINVAYLVAHACVETFYGTSPFATGREYNGKTVYNMFGYAAYDTSPSDAKKAAYNNKWFSPEAAVRGGAKTIAKNYIYNNQNTLYKIRWNPASPGTHQYATDIRWAVTIASIMGKIYGAAPNGTMNLDIPMY